MTTPDLGLDSYVPLDLFDVDVDALVARALERVSDRFPDWTPREGNIEVVLLEAVAVEVQELAYAINRLPAAVTETLLRLFELEPDAGTPPTALLRFAVQTTGAASIPAGTSVALVLSGGLEPVIFRTTSDTDVAPGTTTVDVPAEGTRPTVEANTTEPLSSAVLLDPVPIVNSVAVTITTAGTDPEDSDAFLDRGVARFRRLVSTLVRPEHYTAAARELPEVRRATTLDRYDPGQSPPTGRRGHITVAVAGGNGTPLADSVKTTLETTLERQGHAGLDVHVINTTTTPLAVRATVTRLPDFTAAEVHLAVIDALSAYLSPDTWTFGASVYRNELIALLDRVPGVDLVNLSQPAGDVALVGAAPLVRFDSAGSVITVQ